ncbi:hypothetical protein GLOIN_2v1549555 [Rhizophagus irregularis DAOM 181602=DAOM 197198]|uniref:Uncharacterized protein n=1 Tax=Rhizophagus irregularis (strain DAOM 181602 / DAOM 197198 / MUCL 43194) TaxID=747089 RepID=A0A2P4QHN8_RHIID|nr:hypothetical protein GLOIN_2v1549555 [Rhizophagus irregularis DAOM 181602=DAOM 197198]POG77126.1 hypothetical protein GLOIN_2v1549555 [Rhizophagus irregularis DAOM 181602=DAOM 197198]|eukprot:XP_025183992.1 hypothetical protein GLOIN_2v1549555 [Rhizophagus irregularis DAOM 181602=DAOM 197198]
MLLLPFSTSTNKFVFFIQSSFDSNSIRPFLYLLISFNSQLFIIKACFSAILIPSILMVRP